jgi:hypothetical protein
MGQGFLPRAIFQLSVSSQNLSREERDKSPGGGGV